MLIVYAPTRDRFAALSAGVIFLAFPFVVYWSPLLRIDMLALALSLAGLCLLADGLKEGQPVSLRRLAGVALLLVAPFIPANLTGSPRHLPPSFGCWHAIGGRH